MKNNDMTGEAAAAPCVPPNADLASYLGELDGIDATTEQKLELLAIVFSIMRSFVELGFDVGSVVIWKAISEDPPIENGED